MPGGLDHRPAGFDGAMDHGRQVLAFLPQLDLAAGDARDVQQIVHQPHHVQQLAVHHLAGPLPADRVVGGHADQLQRGPDRRQRIAQLVGQDRQELVLLPVGVAGVAVQPRVLDGDAGPIGQLLGEQEVGFLIAPARAGGQEGQDAQDLGADLDRDDDARLQPRVAQEPAGAPRRGRWRPACRR